MTDRGLRPRFKHRAFTLVEMVVVIAIAGVVAAMVAVFIRSPVEAYVDTARRARLTEAADTALRRLSRDLRTALPNSIRVTVTGGVTYLEYIPTIGGGRYRRYPTNAGAGNPLDFTSADTGFDVLGPAPVYAVGDSVVVFNLGPGSAADAYAGNNRAAATNANGTAGAVGHTLAFVARQFPQPSPAARFHMVQTPVTYACDPGGGTLRRFRGYAFAGIQPTPPAAPAVSDLLVAGVTACTVAYDPAVTRTRTGLVTVWLSLAEQGESVNLVHQVHVQNMP